MTQTKILVFALVAMFSICVSVKAQNAPPFKITKIKVEPYNQLTGEFEPEIKPKDERAFFNEVSLGLLITAEISGKTDTSAEKRSVEITVLEGKKLRAKKSQAIFGVGATGKYYAPIFVESAFCSEVTITVRMVGQTTASTLTRKIPFQCGE